MKFSYTMLGLAWACLSIGSSTGADAMAVWAVMFMAISGLWPVIKLSGSK